jgi:hypothetical protein
LEADLERRIEGKLKRPVLYLTIGHSPPQRPHHVRAIINTDDCDDRRFQNYE